MNFGNNHGSNKNYFNQHLKERMLLKREKTKKASQSYGIMITAVDEN